MAVFLSPWGRVLLFLALSENFVCEAKSWTFALVPKSVDNPFFDVARDGCMDQAALLGLTCLYTGPPAIATDADGSIQAHIISDLIDARAIDGLAVSVGRADAIEPVIEKAVLAGIPVVTFDSDAPNSKRTAYIGTNNYFFGVELAKVLKQLEPSGGRYATVGMAAPNINERVRGFEDEISAGGEWTAVEGSPGDSKRNLTLGIELMREFAKLNVTAITPVMGAPMRSGLWKEFVDEHRYLNITLVSGDAMPNQLEFLSRGYVQGLVGQLPYEMGFMAIKALYDLAEGGLVSQEIIGTNVLTHLKVPLILPELTVDHNLIGNLHVVGFILFGLIACVALGFGVWTYRLRNVRVVKVAQPMFLIMVAIGVLVMASSLIPLSFDDSGAPENQTDREGALMCMSVPWLGFCGFTITFSALMSKTMRINRIFHSKVAFGRVKVTIRDVMAPFVILLSANIVILICWTVIDPLVYVREASAGTDGWNRIISTFGSCRSDHVARYLIPLAVVNLSVLMIANWQAYVSRVIESEFSESKYIAMTMASLLQATLTGVPILFVERESPQTFYLVLTFMVFVTCMAVLLLIFVPKVVMTEAFTRRKEEERQQLILRSICRESSNHSALPGDIGVEQQSSMLAYRSETSSVANENAGADGDGGENLSSEGEDGMKVVRRETIQVLSISVEDEEEAPQANSDSDVVRTDTSTHSGGEEGGYDNSITLLETSNDAEHRGV
jgi:ABC-type sugar transport system substrate-binding protein